MSIITWISLHDPNALLRKCLNSALEFFRPYPSAIFNGIETADLLSWLLSSYFSTSGNKVKDILCMCKASLYDLGILQDLYSFDHVFHSNF